MDTKIVKNLSSFLTAVVVILAAADVALTLTAPWWLRMRLTDVFGDFAGVLGYSDRYLYPLMVGFVMPCGLLCLGILAAAFNILRRIRAGTPFCRRNSESQRNAAFCGFGLAVMFTAKMFFSPTVLTLACVGLFLLFGLFLMVISLLFRQAAQIKEENDLTV